jgi:hypothetical protein
MVSRPLAVVASVPDQVSVRVVLRGVVDVGTVVLAVDDRVSVDVRVTRVPVSVSVQISLVGVGGEETRVTEISYSISVHVVLVQVINKCTIVKFIFDSIVVIITITGVSNAIAVHIPLTTVRDPRAVVQWTGRVVAADGEERIRNAIEIVISSTLSTITKHPNGTFAVEFSRCRVEAVFDSLAVVDSCGTWVGQDAVEGSLFHVAL